MKFDKSQRLKTSATIASYPLAIAYSDNYNKHHQKH